jgi:hypothetical protein
MSSTAGQQTVLRLPTAFVVSEAEAYPYNIVFVDEETQAKLRAALVPLQTAWQTKLASMLFPDSTPDQQRDAARAAYGAFSREAPHAQAVHQIDRLMYWEPGAYLITAHIEAGRRSQVYKWQMSLTQQHCVLLQVNTMTTIQQIIGVSTQAPYVVFVPYESA